MNTKEFFFSILVLVFGVFLFVFGGYDDSPGAQLLGAIIATVGMVKIVQTVKKKSRN